MMMMMMKQKRKRSITTTNTTTRSIGTHTDTRTGLVLERPERMTCVSCNRLGHLTPKNRKCSRTYREEWNKLEEKEKRIRIEKHQRDYIEECNRKKCLSDDENKRRKILNPDLFKDMTFSISLNGESSRDELVRVIHSSGGKVTGQIHKNLQALICSRQAMECNTQRVRKARKRNVPIVTTSFIEYCVKTQKWIEPSEYTKM